MSMIDSKEQVTFELLTLSREAGEPDNPWDKIRNHYFLYYATAIGRYALTLSGKEDIQRSTSPRKPT